MTTVPRTYLVHKRCLDVLISSVVLLVLAPALLLIAVAVLLDSRGPILFRQSRIGRDGRVFQMLKFRTMVDGAERMGTGLFSYADDDRVTRVGRVLRQASLDELPQLWNVLRGEMSLVGPRPPVVNELGPYDSLSDEVRVRFTVPPGITGLAQVSGRNELEWPEKFVYDLEYVRRFNSAGVLEDVRLLFKTLVVVLTGRGVIEPRREEEAA